MNKDIIFKKLYNAAKKSYSNNEIPVGALIVKNNKIISVGSNNRQTKYYIFGHAEINAILKASKKIGDWRLNECDLYVTLEPCNMCVNIINESRINNVYYLLSGKKNTNNLKNYFQIDNNNEYNEKITDLMNKFFKKLRK